MWRKQILGSMLAAAAAVVMAAPLQAQRTVLLEWSGRVDTLVRIRMQGAGAHVTALGSPDVGVGTLRVLHALPKQAGTVGVQLNGGRGIVQIEQQPTAANDYTTTLTIADRSGGADEYHLSATWRPAVTGVANGSVEEPLRIGSPPPAAAVGLLHFTGDIDKSTVVRWHGMRASVRNAAGAAQRQVRETVAGAGLPERDVTVRVVKHEGRGDVVVEQQPSAANGYTAVIRISDEDEGYGHYDFDVVYDRTP
jgi:hypothetical protein